MRPNLLLKPQQVVDDKHRTRSSATEKNCSGRSEGARFWHCCEARINPRAKPRAQRGHWPYWTAKISASHRRPNIGAGNEARTRDLNLGKVALYQLSYSRPKQTRNCRAVLPGVKNNRRHNVAKALNWTAIPLLPFKVWNCRAVPATPAAGTKSWTRASVSRRSQSNPSRVCISGCRKDRAETAGRTSRRFA